MRELARLDAIMPLTLEERGALITLTELAAERNGFVPNQERWLAGWMQCSVRKWRLIRDTLIAKGKVINAERFGEPGFTFEPTVSQPRTNVEPIANHARKVAETETKSNEINDGVCEPRAHVGDYITTSVDPCSGGGGVGARDGLTEPNDWPEANHAELLAQAAGSPWLDLQKTTNLVITAGRIAAWKRRGASWKLHVLPVVTTLAKQHGEPIATWQFFEKAIARAVKASRAEMDLPEGVIPLRPGGGGSITDRIAADNAEARRLAFAMMDQKNGRTN